MSKIKVLFLAANPFKENILSLDEEIRAINQKIRMAEHRDSLDLISGWAVRPDDLLQTLNQHRPHVVHFSGHGTPDGEIMLVGNNGDPTPVTASTLQKLFTTLKDNVQLVVLNACYSEIQARAITKVIDCAIGMNAPVGDNAAIVFAAALYRAIGFGRSIKEAFEQGELAIPLDEMEGEKTPQLRHRRGVDPARIILVSEPTAPDPKALSTLLPHATPTSADPPAIGPASANNQVRTVKIDKTNPLVFASTFLSHSSYNADLVKDVARELGRRGVLAWLDKSEVYAGLSLSDAITSAIKDQATVAAFLSPEAIKSGWVDKELRVALEKEDELNAHGLVMPVFLGDKETLVRSHDLLRKRWLDESGKLVDRIGVIPDDGGDDSSRAKNIASKLAAAIYRRLKIEAADNVVIHIDQRGKGQRRGKPELPLSLHELDAPALVFRPDLGERNDVETLHNAGWEEMRDTMNEALAQALGNIASPRLRKIHCAGRAQLGFAYLIGYRFDRTTNTELHCTGLRETFTNEGQPRESPLRDGNPRCETTGQHNVTILPAQINAPTISLLLCKDDNKYIEDALAHAAASHPGVPAVWVKHEERMTSSRQVMNYVADVVALLRRLHQEKGLRTVHLYTTLPFHAVSLLAANLRKFVVDSVILMEYRSDLHGTNPEPGKLYSPLRFDSSSRG